jgi:hypothetical protein
MQAWPVVNGMRMHTQIEHGEINMHCGQLMNEQALTYELIILSKNQFR